MKEYKVYEVTQQKKPDLLFPDEPVSKRWTKVPGVFKTEQGARNRAIEDEDYKYRVRERIYRFVRKSGFVKGKGEMLGKLIPVHNIEVRETISLKTLS